MTDRYQARRRRLWKSIQSAGIDAFLVTDPLNVRYLSGFAGEDSFLLLGKNREVLLTDSRFETYLAEEMPGFPALVRRPGVTLLSALQKGIESFVPARGAYRLGVESDALSLTLFRRLEYSLEHASPVPICAAVEKLRQIKDRSEIAAIRRSIQAAVRGFDYLRKNLSAEWSEIDFRNELDYRMRRFGAEEVGFPTIVAAGKRAALPHAAPTARKLVDGESFLVDWGAKRDGYVSDLTRVIVTAQKPSAKLRRVYDAVLKAQAAAIRAIRPGVTAEKIDKAARRVIERAGFGERFNHGLGHGLGMVVHDRGGLSVGNKSLLAPGMVLTVEPGVYLPGELGVRIEDDVLVTPDGCEVLTAALPKSFDEMRVEL